MGRVLLLALLALTVARLNWAAAPVIAPSPDFVDLIYEATDVILFDEDHTVYRLPDDVTPSRYVITIAPYFDTGDNATAFTFDGTVVITVQSQVDHVTRITLHSEDHTESSIIVTAAGSELNLVEAYEFYPDHYFLHIDLNTPMIVGQDYTIRIVYTGIIQSGMRGFYRSWYYDGDELKWMGTTQFQPGHARKAFPSFDEPKFKATFVITVVRPNGYSDTISNMPIDNRDILEDGRESQTFYETPLMSTYLIAFIVSQYNAEHITVEGDPRPFGIYARTSATEDGLYAFDVGQAILSKMEEHTNYSYYAMDPNMKMDQAAIPDFSAGAMENYGLLTYREALILYKKGTTSDFYKQRIANIISHEVAHMWFGNLVTCDWWDNLWLNEGFARYYQMFLTHWVETDMGFDTRFVTEHLFNALLSDSLLSAHPLTNAVGSPTIVSAHFSTITYSKGASIIRQTEHLLGEDIFVEGLRAYLRQRAFLTAVPEQLWEHLQNATDEADELNGYGINVADYFSTWSTQPGFPLLTVSVTGSIITVTQSQFNANQPNTRDWVVPITFTTASAPDFMNTKPTHILNTNTLDIIKSSAVEEWVLLNKQATGFYRVNYDSASWDRILAALNENTQRALIHEVNKAYIVNDVLALARNDYMTYARALELLGWLEFETDFAPWAAAVGSLNFVRTRLLHDGIVLDALDGYIRQLAGAFVSKFGFDERIEESFMQKYTRFIVAPLLCRAGHQDCIDAARTKFSEFRNNDIAVSPNSRSWVYCNALRHGTFEDFTFLWGRYTTENVNNEQQVILESLGCSPHQQSIVAYLNHIATTSITTNVYAVRTQDILTAYNAALSSNRDNAVYAFEWFKDNYRVLANRLEAPSNVFSYLAASLYSTDLIDQYELWVSEQQSELDEFYTDALSSVTSARNNLNWISNNGRLDSIVEFFEPEVTEPDVPETNTTPAPDASVSLTTGLLLIPLTVLIHLIAFN